MTITKTQAIRAVALDHPHFTNRQIKAEVWRRYGLEVEGNLIIQAVGPESTRLRNLPYSGYRVEKARDLLKACQGDLEEAKRLLFLATSGQ